MDQPNHGIDAAFHLIRDLREWQALEVAKLDFEPRQPRGDIEHGDTQNSRPTV